jgi:hypothetical protein
MMGIILMVLKRVNVFFMHEQLVGGAIVERVAKGVIDVPKILAEHVLTAQG